MVQLTSIHWVYLAFVVAIIAIMGARKDTLVPCILGIVVIGFMAKGTIVGAVQVLYNALMAAGGEFLGLIMVISLVVAMSKAMSDVGADYLLARPASRLMVNPTVAFWVLGISMAIVSWFVWPSPAVALIGALMLPVAIQAGLPAIGAAVAMNLFGHGIGLSSDWIIQGAPGISAKAAGLAGGAPEVLRAGLPLFVTMGVVTTIAAFIMLRRDMAKNAASVQKEVDAQRQAAATQAARKFSWVGYFGAVAVPAAFLLDVVAMLTLKLKGGDATALIGGTALILMATLAVLEFGVEGFEKVTDYVKDGFMFGIKIFAPVIIIGAFFFLGSEGTAKAVLGEGATGYLTDMGLALSQNIQLSRIPVAFVELLAGAIVGLDGSGFAPLPLTGSLARTFGTAIKANPAVLAALGQIGGVWVGGGTIIPWGIIPVAAICGVSPVEIARRNMIPVMLGFLATIVVAIIIM
ncbi:MAG: hypothetical protein ACM3ZQ_05165 [Bacillota bacterium]